jgi:hypothetical protein
VTYQFLDLHFLERQKLGGTGLHVELASDVVAATFFGGTFDQGGELARFDFLEDFMAAGITTISIDLQKGLDICDTSDNTTEDHEVTKLTTIDMTYRQRLFRSHGFNEDFTTIMMIIMTKKVGLGLA